MTDPQRNALLDEMRATRESMRTTLAGLLEAKRQSEQRLGELQRNDSWQSVTGKSALDNAIAKTRHMIETLDRSIEQSR